MEIEIRIVVGVKIRLDGLMSELHEEIFHVIEM